MTSEIAIAVRVAARALGRAGLVHAYGHCSARIDQQHFLTCPPRPMALVEPGEPCTLVPVTGDLPAGVLGEVRIHQQIYAAQPSVGAVIRFMSPCVMALAALGRRPQMRHGFGTYFAPGVGFWDDIQLIRDDGRAEGVVTAMGDSAGVLMRGNGAVVRGGTIEEALMLAWYLEDMCRVELAALAAGLANEAPVITAADAAQRATLGGGIVERMWDYLTAGDPERAA
ncbi:class II aldolase/adducin family protein [Shinella sp. JR1-6]|jgi:HCOMODA/2-hydroxy-3-carboxy-muconic semialdehyde decarboxylase|uniref:class II aldolase/adducin family protein n=1 Tax=unclassified Shinella TaxID=2643062 RepID=UPI00102D61D1|nr:class II aldolase/adducin family protein [Shinella sp. JR1-6]TAA52812.1 class II aldolase/adducin family protein [Shinella sp. JR1-6]